MIDVAQPPSAVARLNVRTLQNVRTTNTFLSLCLLMRMNL